MKSAEAPERTYSMLGPHADPPSEYEIVTSRLLYSDGRGLAVDVPLKRWYEEHQTGSQLSCADWETFRDPRATTYTAYTRLMQQSEGELARLAALHPLQHDRELIATRAALAATIGPARYLLHGFHMLAAYVGHMAPGGRIVLCGAFQAADELGRIEHLARRLATLLAFDAALTGGKERWQAAPRWQPAREAVERLLVTYDWGEAFTALNLCVKPMLDAALHDAFRRSAEAARDVWLVRAVTAFEATCAWHWAWSAALVEHALAQQQTNEAVLQGWIDAWLPRAAHAAHGIAGEQSRALLAEHARRLGALGLSMPRFEVPA